VEITEVRIFRKDTGDKKLRAFATITFDDAFVVRDIKIIEGSKGLFVAMPSRKVKTRCNQCGHSNYAGGNFCSYCGKKLDGTKSEFDSSGQKQGDHRDIAHPITLECREYIQKKVLEAYEQEKNYSGPQRAGQQDADEA